MFIFKGAARLSYLSRLNGRLRSLACEARRISAGGRSALRSFASMPDKPDMSKLYAITARSRNASGRHKADAFMSKPCPARVPFKTQAFKGQTRTDLDNIRPVSRDLSNGHAVKPAFCLFAEP